jgi:hypothetical protein
MKTVVSCLFFLVLSVVPAAAIVLVPRAGEPVAVMFMPGMNEGTALSRVVAAGGLLLGRGALDNTVIALPGRDTFISEAYRAGAVLVLAAGDVRGCRPIAENSINTSRSASLGRPVDAKP